MDTPSVEDLTAATGGRYDIEGVFAQGGMGTVYSARHRQLGSRLAIKVLPPDVATSTMRLARFKREAALAANLSHPHIVPVFEFDVQEGLAFLVMPFVEGESLQLFLARHGRLHYPAVRQLLSEIGGALGFAHGRGVVHRDIKPANILREEATGRWLITDFGVAHSTRPGDTEITHTGAIIGTPAYMAPEQASGVGDVDGRADLYALGAVAYEALVGTPPNPLSDPVETARALRRARPDVSPKVARTLVAPLEPTRDRRPDTAGTWLALLERAETRRTAVPVIAAITIGLAGIVGWFTVRQPREETPTVPTVAVLPFITDGSARARRPPLDSLLAQAFDWQLRYLPSHRILGPGVRQHPIARAYGAGTQGLDTLLAVARGLGATLALAGRAEARERDDVFIQIQLHSVAGRVLLKTADTTGSVDDLDDLVSALVVAAFRESMGQELTGLATSLPDGLEASSAYWRAQQAFRRGAYPQAIDQFEEVIRLDSTFAPAHFNRMIAVLLNARPTRATTQIRSALDVASKHRSGLDPTSEQLLAGYEVLVREGDIRRAEAMFEAIVEDYPTAVDAWFVLGYVQFFLRALLNSPIGESKFAFEQAVAQDPGFAAALLQLAAIAAIQADRIAGQDYVNRFLRLDSTSVRAELARMGDSLLYRGASTAIEVIGSVSRRPTEVLELFSLAAGELNAPQGTGPLAEAALGALWKRAATGRDRKVAFRMRLAHLVATGRYASADSLVDAAARLGIPDQELDRWIVLSAITPMPVLADTAAQRAAVVRLEQAADDDPEVHWLLARWYLFHAPANATRPLLGLQRIAGDSALASPHARSLLLDVRAVQSRDAGDSARALALWDDATQRYSLESVSFGLTASLWPLRVARAAVALQAGRPDLTLEIAATFDAMAGFIDQVVWSEILGLRAEAALATGQPDVARRAYADILRVLEKANGGGVTLRERTERARAAAGT